MGLGGGAGSGAGGGKKKKGKVKVQSRCYYCDRAFDDDAVLVTHQKAKHFRCAECGKRMNTTSSLAVHLRTVHKEELKT